VDYLFSLKDFFSRNYGLPTSYCLTLWITDHLLVSYFTLNPTSIEEVFVIFKNLEHENQEFHEFIVHLQINQASTSLGCILATQPQPKES
jgi:hypothetical protein